MRTIWSLGPALGVAVNDEQWAQLATSGVIVSGEAEWLEPQATDAGMLRAGELLRAESSAERWGEVLFSCPETVPDGLLRTAAQAIMPAADSEQGSSIGRYPREQLARRLIAQELRDEASALAGRDPVFAEVLTPVLAQAGDVDAQRILLADLLTAVGAGTPPSEDALGWLHACANPVLLCSLFEILSITWRTSSAPIPRIVTRTGGADVVNLVLAAIANIGGEFAVMHYHELLDRRGDFRWLRPQRDRIADAILAFDGIAAAGPAARAAAVPVLSVELSNE